MGIFDNAKSILIGDKEVKSISIDGGVIYEKDEPTPSLPTVTVTVTDYSNNPVENAHISLSGNAFYQGDTDENGVYVFEEVGSEGYSITVSKDGFKQYGSHIDVNQDVSVTVQLESLVTTQ